MNPRAAGSHDRAFDDWIDRARQTTCRQELQRRGLWSRRMFGDAGVPCPGCGGTDRFAVNLRKNLFLCRKSGAGGDAIALARHLDGTTFLQAVETLTGEPPPSSDKGCGEETETPEARAHRIRGLEERTRRAAVAARDQVESAARFRMAERRAAHDLWRAGVPIAGTMADGYLRLRGLDVPAEAHLRFHPALPYNASGHDTRFEVRRPLLVGPALLAAITAPARDGTIHFIGLHRTWLDLAQPRGKALIVDPQTGEVLPAKKVRGSQRGGTIRLAGPKSARSRMIMGEGIETTLAAYAALTPAEREGVRFDAGCDLGNMAGRALGRVPHPTATKMDKRGRARRVFVPDDVPDPADDAPMIGLPDGIDDLTLLGDGDSEPFWTGMALRRAGARFAQAYPALTVRLAMARDGLDFNDMLEAA